MEVPLWEGMLEEGLWDVKVAFRLAEWDAFKEGEIVLKVGNGDDGGVEEYCLFNKEIKGAGLIYNQEGWAIYDSRMTQMGG